MTLGSDWKVYRPTDEKKTLAAFDSKKFNIGGKVDIDIYDPDLVKNRIFVNTLILFGALLKHIDKVRDNLEDQYKKYMKKEIPFKPDRMELQMMENPRSRKN